MTFKLTNNSNRVLEELKEIFIENFNHKIFEKIKIKITKKTHFLAIPIPSTNPAFTLYVNGKFFKSYFYKNEKWIEIED